MCDIRASSAHSPTRERLVADTCIYSSNGSTYNAQPDGGLQQFWTPFFVVLAIRIIVAVSQIASQAHPNRILHSNLRRSLETGLLMYGGLTTQTSYSRSEAPFKPDVAVSVNLGVLVLGVLITRALLIAVSDFWKLPCSSACTPQMLL